MEESKNDSGIDIEQKNGTDKEVKEDHKPVENVEIEKDKNVLEGEAQEKSSLSKGEEVTVEKPLKDAEKKCQKNDSVEDASNTKSVPKDSTVLISEELSKKIRKQVEFYFGDVNLNRDKFLIEQTKLDDGWVPMTVMLNFKMLASISKDIEVIVKSLEDSDLIEVSEDRKKIRRSLDKPLPVYDDNYKKAQEARTIYLKGFPNNFTIENVKDYFEYSDSIENIIMRKFKKGKEHFFKGSIFLQFKTLDDAKAFMEQKSVKYKDTELIKLWSADYVASKEKEREERRQKRDKDNLKNPNSKGSKNNKNNIQDKIKIPKGCVIQISNVKKGIGRDKIKEKLIELECEVAYIDYNPGDEEGWVRLQGENSAVEFLKNVTTNVIQVGDCDITCKLVEGDEEAAYLVKIQETMAHHRLNRRDKGRNGRKGFKRRQHSPHREGNAKKLRTDD